MIIDADVHLSPTHEDAYAATTEQLIAAMDRAGVDKSLAWLRPPYMREIGPSNRYVYEATCQHPKRIIGFGWVDPHLGFDRMKDEIKRCVEEYGFYGIKLNGAQNNFVIDSPQVLPLIEEIAKTGKLLAFHVGTDAFEATHPSRLARIAKLYPETQILMVHVGGVGFADISDSAIGVIAQHPNVTGIGSALRPTSVLKAIKHLGAERICFGSDYPFNLTHVEVAAYRALMEDELSADEQELVWSGNITRLLHLND